MKITYALVGQNLLNFEKLERKLSARHARHAQRYLNLKMQLITQG